jgi:anaerobic selenocysteine-containing dehydrogenase
MRVLVTGVAGRVGSWLADELVRSGYDVRGVVRPGGRWVPEPLASRIQIVEASLTDTQAIARAMAGADVVVVEYLDDLDRLRGRMDGWQPGELVLIGRRQLRSNNSWMHNSKRLIKGMPRCTLLVHPDDAERLGLTDGAPAELATHVGAVEVPVEVSDEMMPGVVSLPHGWGHGLPGTRLRVANEHPGASINDVLDERQVDQLTGAAALSGQRCKVRALQLEVSSR